MDKQNGGNIFYQGIIGAIIGMVIFRPFNRCAKK